MTRCAHRVGTTRRRRNDPASGNPKEDRDTVKPEGKGQVSLRAPALREPEFRGAATWPVGATADRAVVPQPVTLCLIEPGSAARAREFNQADGVARGAGLRVGKAVKRRRA